MKFIRDDIAVVGMACIFPDAPNVTAYWENILAARCSITDHPDEETRKLVDPDSPHFERPYTLRGGYLKDLFTFNPVDFGVMPDSVIGGNYNHFMALRLAKEALDDAGLSGDKLPRERTDVIVGAGSYINPGSANWMQHGLILDQTVGVIESLNPGLSEEKLDEIRQKLRASLPPINPQIIPALIDNLLTGRIANRLDLMGSNFILDAACSSSLIAVDQCVKNLSLDLCDVALAGGVTAGIPPEGMMTFSELGALSHSEFLRPFDRHADGTMLGEGGGMIVLKRRRDAEKDGERIYALIKGLGIASDGKASGLLAPRLEGEALAIKRAYQNTGLQPETVGLIEAHGTGIPLGDRTEIQALSLSFGPRRGSHPTCGVGSVKSMIGHTISAAGMAGLIKVALALYHRILPPTVNCEEASPELELEKTPFYISTETRPWVHGGASAPRRAGVSAMGFGGINSHCVLEEFAG